MAVLCLSSSLQRGQLLPWSLSLELVLPQQQVLNVLGQELSMKNLHDGFFLTPVCCELWGCIALVPLPVLCSTGSCTFV